MAKNFYEELASIDMSDVAESKMNLVYLSAPAVFARLKSKYPLATFKVYENDEKLLYHHDGKTAWVKVGVKVPELAVEGVWDGECIQTLPVMDNRNKSIELDSNAFTSFAINTSIQRCMVKCIAFGFGLGISVYINGESRGLEYMDDNIPIPEGSRAMTVPQMRKEILARLKDGGEDLKVVYERVKEAHGVAEMKVRELPPTVLSAIMLAWESE